jgi:hypothetical protein
MCNRSGGLDGKCDVARGTCKSSGGLDGEERREVRSGQVGVLRQRDNAHAVDNNLVVPRKLGHPK